MLDTYVDSCLWTKEKKERKTEKKRKEGRKGEEKGRKRESSDFIDLKAGKGRSGDQPHARISATISLLFFQNNFLSDLESDLVKTPVMVGRGNQLQTKRLKIRTVENHQGPSKCLRNRSC